MPPAAAARQPQPPPFPRLGMALLDPLVEVVPPVPPVELAPPVLEPVPVDVAAPGRTTTISKACVASGATPLLATTVTLNLPSWLGVQAMSPSAGTMLIPAGLSVRLNVGCGQPDA